MTDRRTTQPTEDRRTLRQRADGIRVERETRGDRERLHDAEDRLATAIFERKIDAVRLLVHRDRVRPWPDEILPEFDKLSHDLVDTYVLSSWRTSASVAYANNCACSGSCCRGRRGA